MKFERNILLHYFFLLKSDSTGKWNYSTHKFCSVFVTNIFLVYLLILKYSLKTFSAV